jgi:flagellar biosynthesis protein FliR
MDVEFVGRVHSTYFAIYSERYRVVAVVTFSEAQLLEWMTAWLLPFFRILGLVMVAPILSHRTVPMRLKIGFSLLLSFLVAPFAPAPVGLSLASNSILIEVVRETAIGASIGFLARVVLVVFELAGETIGLQIGLSYAGYFTPGASTGNAVGAFTSTFGLWFFVTLNGPLLLIGVLIDSFQRLPIQGKNTMPTQESVFGFANLLGELFGTALLLALPVIVLLLLVNIAMGIASKVAPQMNLFAVGFPLLISAGLAMLSLIVAAFEPVIEKLLLILVR